MRLYLEARAALDIEKLARVPRRVRYDIERRLRHVPRWGGRVRVPMDR
jgi:hypothetical protein